MKGIKDMAKLVFNYGAMGSSKTANALMVAYNYDHPGLSNIVLPHRTASSSPVLCTYAGTCS